MIEERLGSRYGERLLNHRRSFSSGERVVCWDLGCGRGEFLKVAQDMGYMVNGIDGNREAIKLCKNAGYEVYCGDILKQMAKIPTASAYLVTSFHVIEHCPSQYFLEVFREAFRILGRGGVFVVETPSLYSLWASARQFYLDPTHDKPVHPELIKFMAEDVGFRNIEMLEFDKAEGPEIVALEGVKDIEPLSKWLYGPMDIALWCSRS